YRRDLCPSHFSENESQSHLKGKLTFQRQLTAIGCHVEIEVTMAAIEQRADVFLPDDRVVLEYQCSPISFTEIHRRTVNYHQLDNDVIWILGDYHRAKALRSEMVAKFAKFQAQLGFYIIFYSAVNDQFWLFYQLKEVAGKIERQTRQFETLPKVLDFMKHYRQPTTKSQIQNKVSLLNQLRRIQQSNVLRNNTYRDMVAACYQSGKLFVGCPMVCHDKWWIGTPVFKQSILCWKVWIVLELFERRRGNVSNQQLNQLFVESVNLFGRQMAQVDNYARFFQIEFTNFMIALRSSGYIRHTVAGIRIIRRPEWFASYDQKRAFILTGNQ
ncbi:competence protein CoiA family protein, partial [Lentilactobacillus kisonensis]